MRHTRVGGASASADDHCSADVTLCWGKPYAADLPFTPKTFAKRWPKHCPDCNASGWQKVGGEYEDYDYCYGCYDNGRCPRCFHKWRRYPLYYGKEKVQDWTYPAVFERMREASDACPYCGFHNSCRYASGGRPLREQRSGHWTSERITQYGPWRVEALERLASEFDGWVRVDLYQEKNGTSNALWIPPGGHQDPAVRNVVKFVVFNAIVGHHLPVVWLEDRDTIPTPAGDGDMYWWVPTRVELQPRDCAVRTA